MNRYRVYVGTGEAMVVASHVSGHFNDATVQPAIGVWEGEIETSTVIEIITERPDSDGIRQLADELRRAFEQESILVTHEHLEVQSLKSPVPIKVRSGVAGPR